MDADFHENNCHKALRRIIELTVSLLEPDDIAAIAVGVCAAGGDRLVQTVTGMHAAMRQGDQNEIRGTGIEVTRALDVLLGLDWRI